MKINNELLYYMTGVGLIAVSVAFLIRWELGILTAGIALVLLAIVSKTWRSMW